MGQELECRLHYGRRKFEGKAQLEGGHILFRGGERLKIDLKDVSSVRADGGALCLEFGGEAVRLELGAAAEKWAHKILHPPTRAEKLGVKPGLTVRVTGVFDADFLEELRGGGTVFGDGNVDLIFLAAGERRALDGIAQLAACLKPAGALWVIYPKGVRTVREIEVLEAGRAAGLKDTKVVAFSGTHTGLRFVIPVAAR